MCKECKMKLNDICGCEVSAIQVPDHIKFGTKEFEEFVEKYIKDNSDNMHVTEDLTKNIKVVANQQRAIDELANFLEFLENKYGTDAVDQALIFHTEDSDSDNCEDEDFTTADIVSSIDNVADILSTFNGNIGRFLLENRQITAIKAEHIQCDVLSKNMRKDIKKMVKDMIKDAMSKHNYEIDHH